MRVVIITYGKGTDHNIERYGYQTKAYYEYGTLEQWEKSPYIKTALGPSSFEILQGFKDEIRRTVNNHLGCECYKDMVPADRLNVGAPHDKPAPKGIRDRRGPEYH